MTNRTKRINGGPIRQSPRMENLEGWVLQTPHGL
jgi:hypothetical protein